MAAEVHQRGTVTCSRDDVLIAVQTHELFILYGKRIDVSKF